MSGKIAFIAANSRQRAHIEHLFEEQVSDGRIIVAQPEVSNLVEEVKNLISRAEIRAIIARGGTYADLAQAKLPVPVLPLHIGGTDVLMALNDAKKTYRKIYLILHKDIFFEYEAFKSVLSLNLECYTYRSVNRLESIMNSLSPEPDSVIVGSGVCVHLAREKDFNFIDITVRDATYFAAYENAVSLVEQTQENARKANLMESILYHVGNGVIITDTDGTIRLFKRKSQELLGLSDREALGQNIRSFIPLKSLICYKGKNLALHMSDFLLDPKKRQKIITIEDVTRLQKLEQDVRFKLSQKGLTAEYVFDDILTVEDSMKKIISQAKTIAALDGSVLIYGESGTGKELFAQSIHNGSSRSLGPFVAVNCAALNESLLESELFGYVGGAFTGARKEGKAGLFEMAHNGTIFLDEINSMSPSLQSKILRVIEEKEVMRVGSDYVIPLDVRIIAACNRPLEEQVRAGAFRQDLFFRLNTFELHIPPLKERKKDIVFLFRRFLDDYIPEDGQKLQIPEEFEDLLKTHSWWGNVRELKSVAYRYFAFGGDNENGRILQHSEERIRLTDEEYHINLPELSKTVEMLVIDSLLDQGMSKTDIAALLGISRQALFTKIKNRRT